MRADPLIGQVVLGRYRIMTQLARGGMGAVYLGRTEGAEGFARPVVIKRILPDLVGDPDAPKMFVREARILSNFHHPNIVSALDFGEEDEAHIMVLEYIHGYDLGRWCSFLEMKKRRMPVDHALHVVARVLDGLHHAHTLTRPDGTELRIVHRDISPTNILIGTDGHIKILDFGIARVTGDAGEFKTRETTFKGKVAYAPPELLHGEEPSPSSDTYSAAVVLYQLLAGKNPFRGRAITETISNVLTGEVRPVPEVRDDTPAQLDAVLARALARAATDRYPSAQVLASALRELRSGSDHEIRKSFGTAVLRDFTGKELPETMGLEALTVRDKAWRQAHTDPGHCEPLRSSNPPPSSSVANQQAETVKPPSALRRQNRTSLEVTEERTPSGAGGESQTGTRMSMQTPAVQKGSTALVLAAGAVAIAAAAVVAAVVMGQQPARTSTPRYLVVEQGNETAPGAPQGALVPKSGAEPRDPASYSSTAPPAGSEAAATVGSAGPTPGAPDAVALTRAFSQQMGPIRSCLDQHREHLGDTQKLSIFFSIDRQGEVKEATLAPAVLAGTPIGECVLTAARAVRFGPQSQPASFRIPVTTGFH